MRLFKATYWLLILWVFFSIQESYAQDPVYVAAGSQRSVSVAEDPNLEYLWRLTNQDTGLEEQLISTTHETEPVLWDTEGLYTVTVQGRDLTTGCWSEPLSMILAVEDVSVVAVDDSYVTRMNETLTGENILDNDTISSTNFNLTATVVTGPEHGTLVLNADGTFEYTPDTGYEGEDSFTYNACAEGGAICDEAVVSIYVNDGALVIANAGEDLFVCLGDTIMLNGSQSLGKIQSYSWTPTDFLDDPTSPTPIFTAYYTGTYELILYVTDGGEEEHRDTVLVNVSEVDASIITYHPLDNSTVVSPTYGVSNAATGETHWPVLEAATKEGVGYLWETSDGTIDGEPAAVEIMAGDTGTYRLQVMSPLGCIDTDSVFIGLRHHPVFVTNPSEQSDTTITVQAKGSTTLNVFPVLGEGGLVVDEDGDYDYENVVIVNQPQEGTLTYDSETGALIYEHTGHITYDATGDNDIFVIQVCDEFDLCTYVTVYVDIIKGPFIVPQGFSPNGDGINDEFEIVGINLYPENSVQILNRWGTLVYQGHGYGTEETGFWDGKANRGVKIGAGKLPTGTYFYIINLRSEDVKLTGWVYLDR